MILRYTCYRNPRRLYAGWGMTWGIGEMSKKDFQYKSIIVKRLKDIIHNIYNIQNTFWDDLLPANRLLPWILFLVQILWISLQNCFQTLYFLDNLFHLRHPQQKTLENPEFPKNAKLFTMAIRCKWFYYIIPWERYKTYIALPGRLYFLVPIVCTLL